MKIGSFKLSLGTEVYARVVARRRSSLRILLALLISITLLLLPNAPLLVRVAASLSQERSQDPQRMGNPKRGKPEATLPNLETVRSETPVTRELPAPIPSTLRSKKVPLQPWDGRRVGEEHLPPRKINNEEPTGGDEEVASTGKRGNNQTKRAHASRMRLSAPPTLLDDTFIDNFYSYALPGYTPLSNEKPYWRDQMRAGYSQGQTSLTLAAREMGRTLFESASYTARGRTDQQFVGDLYWTYLMRDPNNDQGGWNFWTSIVPSWGREGVRRAFDESSEFGTLMSNVVPNGSASGSQTSVTTARVDPRNQPGGGLLTRDATWDLPLLSLPGRADLDLGLALSYSSQVWTTSGPYIYFDEDSGFPSPGFRLGFPTVQRITFDAQVARHAYLLLTPSGRRVELRQVGTSNIYEAADSSYLQLTDIGSSTVVVRSTDGTQMTLVDTNGEYRCSQIKDRNGNYISANYNGLGRLTTVTDTLGRVITFNYDSNQNLLSITQAGKTDPWVTFGWTNQTLGLSFSNNVKVIGTTATAQIPVINQVAVNDGSYFHFNYSNSLQVSTITRQSFDYVQRAQTSFTYQTPASDAPRLENSKVSASNWTGINGVPSLVTTNYSVAGNTYSTTAPDGTVYSETYGTGWQKGLLTSSQVVAGGVVQKSTTTNWSQDNTSVSYETNPRVTETNVYDASSNRKRTTIDYHSQFGLPHIIAEYAADATNVLRYTYLDYKNDSQYIDRRIIGLLFRRTVKDGSYNTYSKVEYGYDWGSPYFEGLSATPTQHDGTNYGTSFVSGRGNVSSVDVFDASDSENYSKIIQTKFGHNLTGSVIFTRDGLNHQNSVSYTDAFSDSVNRNTFAYPTTMTDADSASSYVQYNFEFGGTTRIQGPPPAGQSQGAIQTMLYNSIGQLERVTTTNNGAYQRFIYGPDYTTSLSTVNNVTDEAYSTQVFDGLGRPVGGASNHPGSTGGYKAQITIYDQMGRSIKVSNPAEITGNWIPVGDDVAGWLYTQQTYNWQGKPLITTNPDSTTKEASYSGCGCAGGEVVTLTDEGTIDGGVAKRRQQKIYSDVLGRTVKNEILNWQGGSVYSATVKTYNPRDQVTQVREFAGAVGSGTYQDTTMTYDGYGRLQTQHLPEQQADINHPNSTDHTTWTYNADGTVATVKDARGALTALSYAGTNRGLVMSKTHTMSGLPTLTASFTYDAVGNRTSMTDDLGSTTYSLNQLSQITSETRVVTGVGTFSINYGGYNLAGQLTGITDPFGAQIGYSFDSTRKLSSVSGANFASVTSYASTFRYRAWGALKSASFGDSNTVTVGYNSNQQATSFEIPGLMKKAYQYYDDGRLKFTQDQAITNSKFDRSYYMTTRRAVRLS